MHYLSKDWFHGVFSRSLNVFLIIHLQHLVLSYAFFLLSQTPAHHSYLSDWVTDWLSPPSVHPAALGIVLTSGCATSRHCQQQELPGVRIHCCDSDLCNSTPLWHPSTLHYICALLSVLLLRMWVWSEVKKHINRLFFSYSCYQWNERVGGMHHEIGFITLLAGTNNHSNGQITLWTWVSKGFLQLLTVLIYFIVQIHFLKSSF